MVALSVLSYEGQISKLVSTSLQYLTSLETLKSDELRVNGMPKPCMHRSLLPELRDLTFLAVAVAGSAISVCDKITEREGEREGALSEREWLTAWLDHPTTKDCFPHFADGLVMRQTEQLTPGL